MMTKAPVVIESSNPMQQMLVSGNNALDTANQHDLLSKASMLQVQVQVAKQYERNIDKVRVEVVSLCQMPQLAEKAMYAYPKGGQVVAGPSIRLIEAIAQAMGNIEYGIVELQQTDKEVLLEAFAWDIEKNVRRSMRWTVKMVRDTKKGSYALNDQRDRYEMMANMGMRRVRACLMAVIPSPIQELAIETVKTTLMNHGRLIKPEQQGRMLDAFAVYGIERGHLEKYLGHKLDKLTAQEAMNLRMICDSLEAGIGKPSEFFAGYVDKGDAQPQNESVGRINEKLKKQSAKGGKEAGDGTA